MDLRSIPVQVVKDVSQTMSVFDSDVRYLQAYKIPELFDDLMRQLLSERPSQPVSFLGSKLVCAQVPFSFQSSLLNSCLVQRAVLRSNNRQLLMKFCGSGLHSVCAPQHSVLPLQQRQLQAPGFSEA